MEIRKIVTVDSHFLNSTCDTGDPPSRAPLFRLIDHAKAAAVGPRLASGRQEVVSILVNTGGQLVVSVAS